MMTNKINELKDTIDSLSASLSTKKFSTTTIIPKAEKKVSTTTIPKAENVKVHPFMDIYPAPIMKQLREYLGDYFEVLDDWYRFVNVSKRKQKKYLEFIEKIEAEEDEEEFNLDDLPDIEMDLSD